MPSHTGGLLDLPERLMRRLKRSASLQPDRVRRIALEMIQSLATSDVPAQAYGPGVHLLELAENAITRGEGARYEGCRLSLEDHLLLAGLCGLDHDPAEATVLLGAAHLLDPDPFVALAVAYGMMTVRRVLYEGQGQDAGCQAAELALRRLL
ncbi:hypothetical protein EON77_05745 [bacterium]|nr:MAG: hypothetical protein EON77_05745 [bacterium]